MACFPVQGAGPGPQVHVGVETAGVGPLLVASRLVGNPFRCVLCKVENAQPHDSCLVGLGHQPAWIWSKQIEDEAINSIK